MAYQNIIAETRGKVGVITLNRPQALNALSPELMRELASALDAFEGDDDIGCQGEVASGARGHAIDRADHRHAQRVQPQHQRVVEPEQCLRGEVAAACGCLIGKLAKC